MSECDLCDGAWETGHGQLGLTLAATTARLVRDLAAFRRPNIDLAVFAPERFAKGA